MTKQREIELMFMQRGINEHSLKLDDYYLDFFDNWSEKKSVRDIRKHELETEITVNMSFVRFASNLLNDIITQKEIIKIVKKHNFTDLEAYTGEYQDQLNWLKIIKRASEPILEKEYLKIKKDMKPKIIKEYQEKLKGFKFILK